MKTPSLRTVLFALVAAAVVLGVARAISNRDERHVPFQTSLQVEQLVDDNTVFALDLYRQLKPKPGNLFFSPFGISAALNMARAGARDATETEMGMVLRSTNAASFSHNAWNALHGRLQSVRGRRTKVETANLICFQHGARPLPAFEDAVAFAFGAETAAVDFARDPARASARINRWIEKHTHGEIEGFVSPAQLGSETRIMLCNAIYFYGRWKSEFKPDHTRHEPFYRDESDAVNVPMMHATVNTRAVRIDGAAVSLLEVPYRGDNLSMVILLPETNTMASLAAVEQALTRETLHSWLTSLRATPPDGIQVGLPRFSMANRFGLKAELEKMGMQVSFSADADFSGINRRRDLFISEVVHQAKIEVEEQGTRASAVTSVEMECAAPAAPPRSFVVDHPFLFFIRDNGSGSILFVGRVVDPSIGGR